MSGGCLITGEAGFAVLVNDSEGLVRYPMMFLFSFRSKDSAAGLGDCSDACIPDGPYGVGGFCQIG